MSANASTPNLSDKFANFQQADQVNLHRSGQTITIEAETKIPYRKFSSEGSLRAIMLSYKETAGQGAPVRLNFDTEDSNLVKEIRDQVFPNSNIVSGDNNSIAIDGIRPNETLDKLEEVFGVLRDKGILQEEPPKEINGFTIPAQAHSYFISSLNRVLEKRDNLAREESYKIGLDPAYDGVNVTLTEGASAVWGQDLPDLTPLDERPTERDRTGNYFEV